MQFATTLLALAATVGSALAENKLHFLTLDKETRTIVFVPNTGLQEIASVECSNNSITTVTFPESWGGNFVGIREGEKGADGLPKLKGQGMLGEVTFQGNGGTQTSFDVSAIVIPDDKNNIKQMWPKASPWPMSGCQTFPCNNAYYVWNAVQDKQTTETELVVTLGEGVAYGLTDAEYEAKYPNGDQSSSGSQTSGGSQTTAAAAAPAVTTAPPTYVAQPAADAVTVTAAAVTTFVTVSY